MKVAFLQCIGGAAGDMIISALVDAGLPKTILHDELSKLKIKGFELEFKEDSRGGVTGTHLNVKLNNKWQSIEHWSQFTAILDASELTQSVKEKSKLIFKRLEDAESHAHKKLPDEIKLHELGSFDTLVDVVASVVGFEAMGVKQIYSSALPSNSGIVKSGHGNLPIPAPATMNLMVESSAITSPPISENDIGLEMVTPTGAAIITSLAEFRQPTMKMEHIGYGLGTKNPQDYPNVLGLWIGEEIAARSMEDVLLLETNIDNMSPELFGYVQNRLLNVGAYDVWFTPIQMKKNRPAVVLSVLVSFSLEYKAVDIIMRETSTLGVRVQLLNRHKADRKIFDFDTMFGPIKVKAKIWDGKIIGVSPEYEDCKQAAIDHSIPLQRILDQVKFEAENKFIE